MNATLPALGFGGAALLAVSEVSQTEIVYGCLTCLLSLSAIVLCCYWSLWGVAKSILNEVRINSGITTVGAGHARLANDAATDNGVKLREAEAAIIAATNDAAATAQAAVIGAAADAAATLAGHTPSPVVLPAELRVVIADETARPRPR